MISTSERRQQAGRVVREKKLDLNQTQDNSILLNGSHKAPNIAQEINTHVIEQNLSVRT